MIGFDEYMNIVMDDAFEIDLKNKTKKSLGRILLKGDNVTVITRRDIQHYRQNDNNHNQ